MIFALFCALSFVCEPKKNVNFDKKYENGEKIKRSKTPGPKKRNDENQKH